MFFFFSDFHQKRTENEEIDLLKSDNVNFSTRENEPVEDWKLSFKNSRPIQSQPMTLYSRRMMQKLMVEDNKQLNAGKENKIIVEGVIVAQSVENKEKLMSEKEPGELTDDEYIIERSQAFQEAAKVASLESKIIENSTRNTYLFDKKEIYKKPQKNYNMNLTEKNENQSGVIKKRQEEQTGGSENLEMGSHDTKDCNDAIEFSPFKNNYKLIAFSPIKKNEGCHVITSHFKKISKKTHSQKIVENSIFGLLSSVSSVSDGLKPNIEDQEKRNKAESISKLEGINLDNKNILETVSYPNDVRQKDLVSIKKKGDENKLEKKRNEKLSGSTYNEMKDPEPESQVETAPGETTQFLDFFLLTTSPSKPILPAELKNKDDTPSKSSINSTTEKSDLEINTSKHSNTSEERLTFNILSDTKINAEENLFKKSGGAENDTQSKIEPLGTVENTPAGINAKNTPTISPKVKKKEMVSKKNDRKKAQEKATGKKGKLTENQEKTERNKRKRRQTNEGNNTKNETIKKLKIETSSEKEYCCPNLAKSTSKSEENSSEKEKSKEDISFFEFFQPITKKEGLESSEKDISKNSNSSDFKTTTTVRVSEIVQLETPNKSVQKVQNLIINEQTMYQVFDTKNNSSLSPIIVTNSLEMTPRLALKHDLTLSDTDDDLVQTKQKDETIYAKFDDCDDYCGDNENMSDSDKSDSGASDFVDLL